jgi:hypothetical protein
MSHAQITHLVAGCSAVFALAAWIGFVVVPAWRSYSGVWQRLAATFLSVYVLAAFMLLGVGGGAAVVYFWDRYGV